MTDQVDVLTVMPSEVSLVPDGDGWCLTARVPLEDGGEGLAICWLGPLVLQVKARARRPAVPVGATPPVLKSAWLTDYVVTLSAPGVPGDAGITLRMPLAGEVVRGGPA